MEDGGDFEFGQLALGDVEEVDDASGVAVLKDDPEVVVFEVAAVVLDDVLVITYPQDLDLLLDC